MDKAEHASVQKEKKKCEKNNAKIWGSRKKSKRSEKFVTFCIYVSIKET